jgi:hypothetical protein
MEVIMFRYTPNGGTKRHSAQLGRAGPHLRRSRGDPGSHLRIVESSREYIEQEEIDNLMTMFTQKESKS